MTAPTVFAAAPPSSTPEPRVAYFSMEIALESDIPTYSGGLGVLAGDTLLSAADLRLPVIAVTMVHRFGYFVQRLDGEGRQHELPAPWDPARTLERFPASVTIEIEGRAVRIEAWRYELAGASGSVVPVMLLDTDVDGNDPRDRALVGSLYGGDERYRLAQEAVLGYGGWAMLQALGIAESLAIVHMNEGHAALLVAAAIETAMAAGHRTSPSAEDLADVKARFVFTTHTPVPAGHDRFAPALTRELLGGRRAALVDELGATHEGLTNMSHLALAGSHYVNGVAMRHGEVSRELFPGETIHAITNGVHAARWTAPAFAELYDRHIPSWRDDNAYLRHAVGIPLGEISAAHRANKLALVEMVAADAGVRLDPDRFTIGFARRAAAYKRGALVFSDLDRLRAIAERAGPLQFVFGGKAHPKDEDGKAVIREIFEASRKLGDAVKVVYLANYEMKSAALITSGVDVWLNTPRPPLEASGTSGMKSALNGVPSLSTIDGWWVEGCIDGVTGWAIGHGNADASDADDARLLYERLENDVASRYYRDPEGYAWVRRNAIALNGSYFNTQRMVEQYALGAYGLVSTAARG